MLIGYGHADAGGRSRLVALEQGEQFRAQTIAAGCSDGVHGEEWDHDLPKLHERRIIAVAVICQIEAPTPLELGMSGWRKHSAS
jgi:hypothetical protein